MVDEQPSGTRVVRSVKVSKPVAVSEPPKRSKWLYMTALVVVLAVSGIVMIALWGSMPGAEAEPVELDVSRLTFAAAVRNAPSEVASESDAELNREAIVESSNQVSAAIISINKVLEGYE